MPTSIAVLDATGTTQTVATNDALATLLTALLAKDFATQATLAAVMAKILAAPATEAKQDTANTSLTEIRNGAAVDYSTFAVGTAGAAATKTLPAAGAGVRNVIGGIAWSLSGVPASAVTVSISDAAVEFVRWYVTVGGPSGVIVFPRPIRGSANSAMTATVSAPGGAILASISFFATRTE